MVSRNLDSALFPCPVQDSLLRFLVHFHFILSLSADISLIEKFFHKMVISLEDWSGQSFFTWISRQFWTSAQTLCCHGYSSIHLCLSVSPRHNSRRLSLSMLVPRKKWTVPQLTGVYGRVQVPRNLDCTLLPWRSLTPWSRQVSRQP